MIDDDLYEKKEISKYFDIRQDALYKKLGGMRATLELAEKLKIRIFGTLINRNDLAILITEHNETTKEDKHLYVNENDEIKWKSDSGQINGNPLPVSSLEKSIFALELADQKKSSQIINQLKKVEAEQSQRSIFQEYMDVVSSNQYDTNKVGLANSLLEKMIDLELFKIKSEDFSFFIRKTHFFISKYHFIPIYDFVKNIFDFVENYKKEDITDMAFAAIGGIQRELKGINSGHIPKNNEEVVDQQKQLASLNLKAFNFFKKFDERDRIVDYIKRSSYNYFTNLKQMYDALSSEQEKKKVINDAMEFGHDLLSENIQKDMVSYVSTHYFMLFFAFENYLITQKEEHFNTTKTYLSLAVHDLPKIKNPKIKQNLERNIMDLQKKVLSYGR